MSVSKGSRLTTQIWVTRARTSPFTSKRPRPAEVTSNLALNWAMAGNASCRASSAHSASLAVIVTLRVLSSAWATSIWRENGPEGAVTAPPTWTGSRPWDLSDARAPAWVGWPFGEGRADGDWGRRIFIPLSYPIASALGKGADPFTKISRGAAAKAASTAKA